MNEFSIIYGSEETKNREAYISLLSHFIKDVFENIEDGKYKSIFHYQNDSLKEFKLPSTNDINLVINEINNEPTNDKKKKRIFEVKNKIGINSIELIRLQMSTSGRQMLGIREMVTLLKINHKEYGDFYVSIFLTEYRHSEGGSGAINIFLLSKEVIDSEFTKLLIRFLYRIMISYNLIHAFRKKDDDVHISFIMKDHHNIPVTFDRKITVRSGNEYKYENYNELISRIMFFLSKASMEKILVLSGPPGTGKSTIITDALKRMASANPKLEIGCIMDSAVLRLPSVLLSYNVLIAENSESLVLDRRISNSEYTRLLLEMGDGLMSTVDGRPIKIIISVNTEDKIDPAIIRPGRGEQIVIPKLGIDFVKRYTFKYALQEISDIFEIDPEKDFDFYWNEFRKIIRADSISLAEIFSIVNRVVRQHVNPDLKGILKREVEDSKIRPGFRTTE